MPKMRFQSMHVHRLQVAATIGWLFLLFNIERIYEPINLASFVYALAALGGMQMLLIRRLRDAPVYGSIGAALAVHIVVKTQLGYAISAENLLLTMAEAVAIAITMGLAAITGRTTDRFTEATNNLALMHRPSRLPTPEEAQRQFDGEIRRARRHERSLSLVTIRPTLESLRAARPRFALQLERELVERYMQGRIADLLDGNTKAQDLIAREGDGFVLLLPETDRNQAEQMVARIQDDCLKQLGIDTRVQVAAFPENELTLSALLAYAHSGNASTRLSQEQNNGPTSRSRPEARPE